MKLGTAIGKPVFSGPKPSSKLAIPDAKVGIEVEVENWNSVNGTTHWDNHNDDSLRNNGQEFTTKGGLIGVDIIEAVEELCALAVKNKWSVGHPRAGIHVHIDCTDLDISKGQLATFISLYMLVEHMMFGFAGEWRRACGFCDAFEDSQADFTNLSKALFDTKGRDLKAILRSESAIHKYSAVNIRSLDKFGTVEFRQLPTTFDATRILQWVNIILQLKKSAVDFDTRTPLIEQFSGKGAERFLREVLGNSWEVFGAFFRQDKAWNAIESSICLMSYARVIQSAVDKEETAALWQETPAEGHRIGWLDSKLKAGMVAKKAKSSKEDTLLEQLDVPVPLPAAPRRRTVALTLNSRLRELQQAAEQAGVNVPTAAIPTPRAFNPLRPGTFPTNGQRTRTRNGNV